MVELTRVFTVEVTCIVKYDDNTSEVISKDRAKDKLANGIKETFMADDVVVTNVQDFIKEVKD